MIERFHCLECDYEWDNDFNGYPEKCPECESDEFYEEYQMTCEECGNEFVGASDDECPECGSCDTCESE